jgi:hypothetical protein
MVAWRERPSCFASAKARLTMGPQVDTLMRYLLDELVNDEGYYGDLMDPDVDARRYAEQTDVDSRTLADLRDLHTLGAKLQVQQDAHTRQVELAVDSVRNGVVQDVKTALATYTEVFAGCNRAPRSHWAIGAHGEAGWRCGRPRYRAS